MNTTPPRLGYLLRTFPVLSETFVAGEIREVARLTGQQPVVAAMFRPGQGQEGGWTPPAPASVRYWRDIDKGCLGQLARAHARLLLRSPARAIRTITLAGDHGLGLKDRIKSAGLAAYFLDHGVGHLHSHFGWEQADMLGCLKRFSGLPYSLTLHAADIFVNPGELSRRLNGASFLATISEYNKRQLIERFHLTPESVHVVHCGVDLSVFTSRPMPQDAPTRLVSVGRMVAKKGFVVLLRALALLKSNGVDVETDLVGDGPERPELMRLAGELGLDDRVRFLGALKPGEAASRIENGHIFALACQVAPDGDMDGIPVALMEAMALGRPVVSTRLSGIPELLAEGCGLLAEPGDPYSLAQQIHRLVQDPDLARTLVAGGRSHVERSFSLEAQARRILELAACSAGVEQ
jgi:glycosyltransferase involved in cell wall biosynthesis